MEVGLRPQANLSRRTLSSIFGPSQAFARSLLHVAAGKKQHKITCENQWRFKTGKWGMIDGSHDELL
jgi:hypothetical protein